MAGKAFHFGDWLRLELSDLGLEVNKAAARIGVDESTLHRWMSHPGYNIRGSARGRLAQLLRVDVRRLNFLIEAGMKGVSLDALNDEAAREVEEQPDPAVWRSATEYRTNVLATRPIPFFLVQLPAGRWAVTEPRDAPDGYVQLPADVDREAFALKIIGDSMEPAYPTGAVVVFVPIRPGELGSMQFENGADYYCEHADSMATFKRVYFEPDRERYRLVPLNSRYRPIYVPEQMMARLSRAVRVVSDAPRPG